MRTRLAQLVASDLQQLSAICTAQPVQFAHFREPILERNRLQPDRFLHVAQIDLGRVDLILAELDHVPDCAILADGTIVRH